jgi:hypothetical protein
VFGDRTGMSVRVELVIEQEWELGLGFSSVKRSEAPRSGAKLCRAQRSYAKQSEAPRSGAKLHVAKQSST